MNLRQRRAAKAALSGCHVEPYEASVARVEPQQGCERGAGIAHGRERRDDERHRRRYRTLPALLGPRGAHRHRILADRDRNAEANAGVDRHRAHRVVERGILAGMSRRCHPVRRELDVADCGDVGRGDIGDRLGDRHASRRRRIDQRERRALADRHRFAGVTFEIHERDRDVRDRHLPRTDHRVARAQAAHGAVADRDQECLVGDRRQVQDAIERVLDRDLRQVEARQGPRKMTHVACHPGRLAEDHVERYVDRAVAKVLVGDDEAAFGVGRADDGERTALALAQGFEHRQRRRRDGEHVALLRLVAPDLARRHARLLRGNRTKLERTAGTSAMRELGQRIGQAAGTDVVNRQNRIALPHLPAAVDDLLRTPLDLGVAALHGIEVEVGRVDTGRHRRRRAAAHADQHPGATELDQERAGRQRMLVRMVGADVAHAARDHDRLVIAAHFAGHLLLERAKVAREVGPAEFVVERCGADRAFDHDRQCGGDAVGLAEVLFPRVRQSRYPQVRNRESHQSGFRLRTDAGGAFVADLAARSRGGAGKRRDRGRMIVRLDLHQRMRELARRGVPVAFARMEARDGRAFHHRGVVGIGDHGACGMGAMRLADHREQALRLRHAVDDPLRVEDLVPAVLRVRLREHHELDVGRIAPQAPEICVEVVDLVGRQREPELGIGALERRPAGREQRDRGQRTRRNVLEQARGITNVVEHGLGHAVVHERQQRRPVVRAKRYARRASRSDRRRRARCATRRRAGNCARCRWPWTTTARWCRDAEARAVACPPPALPPPPRAHRSTAPRALRARPPRADA